MRGSSDQLPRAALVGRLADALYRGSLLLVAGAGYGKTTALEAALGARSSAWVRCSTAHADPGRLLESTVAALQQAAPGAADVVAERLHAPGGPPVDVAALGATLTEELDRLVVDPLAIVFDDAENLETSEPAVELLRGLLAVRNPHFAVAVATRRPLPLRGAKLMADGRLTELGPADLAFTAGECSELVELREGRAPTEAEVGRLWTATEGWPLAVALVTAASASRRPERLTELESLVQFMGEEVLDPLPHTLRDGLIDSSVAPELDVALVEALRLPGDFLAEIARLGLPLGRLEDDGARFVHHPLVRDLLRERLRQTRSEERRHELHARCAEWLEAQGRGAEAVDHWLESGDVERAAGAVARHGSALAPAAPGTVAGWLDRLGDEARQAPSLRFLDGQLAAGSGRLDDTVEPLRDAIAGFAAAGDEDSAWHARLRLAETLALVEDFEAVIPLSKGWESAHVPGAPMVAVLAAVALAGAGRYGESAKLAARVRDHPFGGPIAPFARGATGVDLLRGRLDDALAALREADVQLERSDPFGVRPRVLGMEAVVRDERGEHDQALAAFASARELASEAVFVGNIDDTGRRFAASVHARAGRHAEAERELEALVGPGLGWYAGDAEITRATIAAGRGSHAEAIEWAERAVENGALGSWPSRSRNAPLLAPVVVAAGRPAWATEMIDSSLAERPPEAGGARLLALRAWLLNLEGDESGALDCLARAWNEAGDAPEHLIRRERPRIQPLLMTALERGVLPAGDVIRALEAVAPGGAALLSFADHTLPEVRRAAVTAVAASGHPQAHDRLRALEGDPDARVAAAARAALGVLAETPPPRVFTLLGGFTVRRGPHRVSEDEWGARRRAVQRLVRYLLVHRDAPVPEDDLFAAFWPDASTESARRGLQVTLSSARAVLDEPGAETSAIERSDRNYRIVLTDRDVVDADEFEAAVHAALAAAGHSRRDRLEAAAARWGGEPFIEDRYEDWAASARAHLADLYSQVLAALADEHAASGDHVAAVAVARRQLDLDPLDEGAHRRLMLAYARSGRRGHALRQFLACRQALVDGLGIEPAAETAALQRRILAGEAV